MQPRRVPAEGLFIVSAISQYIGAAIAISVFDQVAPQSVGWLRVVGATVALWLIARPRLGQWRGRKLRGAAVFGIATAAMNTFFYLGIARIDLGKSVAIEFIGPIAVAAFATRSLRNAIALGCAITGVLVLGGVEIGGEPAGVAFIRCVTGCSVAVKQLSFPERLTDNWVAVNRDCSQSSWDAKAGYLLQPYAREGASRTSDHCCFQATRKWCLSD